MGKGVIIWGYLASFVLLLGAIFLNHNFNAGRVLYLTGFFAFNLGYLIPLFLVIFKEYQENKIGLVLVFGILGFITFLTGVSFFVVNWGGGIILIYVGAGILILAILTIIALSRRFYETHIDSWFPILVFGVFIIGSLLIGMVHRHVMRAFTISNKQSLELLYEIKSNNKALYAKIDTMWLADNSIDSLDLSMIRHLKLKSLSVLDHIEKLKVDLIQEVEGDEYKLIEGPGFVNLVPIQSNVEINTVSRYMLKNNRQKAKELKAILEGYKTFIGQFHDSSNVLIKPLISASLNTQTYDLSKRKFNKNWEYQHFYHLPLITVLSDLSNMQLKVVFTEGELLKYFYLNELEQQLISQSGNSQPK